MAPRNTPPTQFGVWTVERCARQFGPAHHVGNTVQDLIDHFHVSFVEEGLDYLWFINHEAGDGDDEEVLIYWTWT